MKKQNIRIYDRNDTPSRDLGSTVIAFNNGSTSIMEYGEIVGGNAQYIFKEDLMPTPKRTASELLEFQCKEMLDIAYVEDIDGELEYIDIMNGRAQQLTGKPEGFITLEAALNYIMDQEEDWV